MDGGRNAQTQTNYEAITIFLDLGTEHKSSRNTAVTCGGGCSKKLIPNSMPRLHFDNESATIKLSVDVLDFNFPELFHERYIVVKNYLYSC